MRPNGIVLRLYAALFIKDKITQFLFNFPKLQDTRIFLGQYDGIVTFGKKALVKAEKFSESSLDPVSFYGVSHLFADSNPQSRNAQPVFHENDRKMLGLKSSARAI